MQARIQASTFKLGTSGSLGGEILQTLLNFLPGARHALIIDSQIAVRHSGILMKDIGALTLCMLLVGAYLLCGCSTAKFRAIADSQIFQGKGGEVHSVDGIDFWENGEPFRQYRVLGVIEEDPKNRQPLQRVSSLLSNSDDRNSAMAKIVHDKGGDAVILVAKVAEPATDASPATEGRSGNRSHPRFTVVVVKYVE